MATNTLYLGARSPQVIRVYVTQRDTDFDLTEVTGAEMIVSKPDGTPVTWTCVVSAQTTDTLTATYELADTGDDLDQLGTYHFYTKLTLPTGTLDVLADRINVIDPLAQ